MSDFIPLKYARGLSETQFAGRCERGLHSGETRLGQGQAYWLILSPRNDGLSCFLSLQWHLVVRTTC